MRQSAQILFGIAFCLSAWGCERSQEWPSRPVTLVCPWSAGGGTDRVSRQMAAQLESELGVPVNVVNATGGGGVTGHTRGAMAQPDGYTLLMATVELNMLHWRGLCPITPESYRPLAKLNEDSAAIFVRADSSWETINELENAFRETQESIPVSGTAAGGIWHLALVGWLMSQEVPIESANWISINGSAPSLQELMAGGIEVVCCSIPEAGALLDAGEIRCLGVMSPERCPAAPKIPTFQEQGIDWSMGGWRGMMYPKDVPEERAKLMEAAILKVARSDQFSEFMDNAGFNISVTDGATFANYLKKSDQEFGDILTQPAMQGQQAAPLSPYFVPGLLSVIAVVIGVFGFMASAKSNSNLTGNSENHQANWPILLGFIGSILLFLICFESVGYLVASAALLAVLLLMLKTHIPTAALLVVLVVPGLYQVFSGLLGVPLPWGWMGW